MKDNREDTSASGGSRREAPEAGLTEGRGEMLEAKRIAQAQAAILRLLANAIVARMNRQGQRHAMESGA